MHSLNYGSTFHIFNSFEWYLAANAIALDANAIFQ